MARVAVDRTWTLKGERSNVAAAIDEAARHHGLNPRAEGAGIALQGGSQTKMRVLGGWFVKGPTLPKSGTVLVTDVGETAEVRVHLEDSMGFGVMDPKLRGKYERVLEEIVDTVGARLALVAESCEQQ